VQLVFGYRSKEKTNKLAEAEERHGLVIGGLVIGGLVIGGLVDWWIGDW
jgi:hypothetical protein